MADKICKKCGYCGTPETVSSFALGLGLWMICIPLAIAFYKTIAVCVICVAIPLLFSLYKLFAGSKSFCPSCKGENTMVSIDSPIGKKLYEKYQNNKEKNSF